MVLPKQLNSHESMFGGEVCAIMDKAAANLLHMVSDQNFVTACIEKLQFLAPIRLGDIITVYGEIVKVGNTSVTVHVEAFAESKNKKEKVTESKLVFVALNNSGVKTKFKIKEQQCS